MRQENDGEMELPGEITTVEDPLYSASLNYPMPGRPMKAMNKDEGKNTARVAPTVSPSTFLVSQYVIIFPLPYKYKIKMTYCSIFKEQES
jgi:hypothetical protein